jgi:hypothetical protein
MRLLILFFNADKIKNLDQDERQEESKEREKDVNNMNDPSVIYKFCVVVGSSEDDDL